MSRSGVGDTAFFCMMWNQIRISRMADYSKEIMKCGADVEEYHRLVHKYETLLAKERPDATLNKKRSLDSFGASVTVDADSDTWLAAVPPNTEYRVGVVWSVGGGDVDDGDGGSVEVAFGTEVREVEVFYDN